MKTNDKCLKCGIQLNAEGLCPACLMQHAMNVTVQSNEAMPSIIGTPTIRYFGNYELQREIARGGMGIVYKARQVNLNRIVAVKTILAGHLADDDSIKRFHTEAEAAANLQHPNIVAIHEVGEQDGLYYFSMDFVEGKNLAQVAGGKSLAANQAATYVKKMAEAIHFAHQRGTLHRDLKPSNVLIDEHDEPRITDFGLAKIVDCDSSLTRSGTVLGTPNYMAPEQAIARADLIGPQSDVYALGAMLYELLTGRPPFKADSVQATLMKVANEEPAAPRKINPNAPVDLETICLKCLEKSPQRRYSSARDLAEDLGRFLKHEPILARPITASRKIEQWAKRNPMLLAAVAALAFLAVSATAYWLWQQNQYLVWHAAHQDVARVKGARAAYEDSLFQWTILISNMALFAFIFFNKPIRGIPASKMFDARWRAALSKKPMSARAMVVYQIIGLGSIVFCFYDLAKLIDARVWEGYSRPAQYSQIYCMLYFGAMLLWRVRGERHAQLFGRDVVAMDASNIPSDLNDRVLALVRDNKAGDAIKVYRETTGCNLDHAAAVVGKIAQQNGVPLFRPLKLSVPKLARNFAITALAVAVAWFLLPLDIRTPALILFSGSWLFIVAMQAAIRLKEGKKIILSTLALLFFIATIIWGGHASGTLCAILSIFAGLMAGNAFIKMAYTTARAKT